MANRHLQTDRPSDIETCVFREIMAWSTAISLLIWECVTLTLFTVIWARHTECPRLTWRTLWCVCHAYTQTDRETDRQTM